MIVSFQKKFIFVHTYKVAGSSIREVLSAYQWRSSRSVRILNRATKSLGLEVTWLKDRTYPIPQHASAAEAKKILSPKVFDTFFKFAFVRNPWDWQVSLYCYIRSCKYHYQHELICYMKNFEEYLEWRIHNKQLQKSFICDATNQVLVDFVGRYETITADFNQICRLLDIQATLPHLNSSPRDQDYRSYYTARTASLLADAFAEDITFFGYTFDPQPANEYVLLPLTMNSPTAKPPSSSMFWDLEG